MAARSMKVFASLHVGMLALCAVLTAESHAQGYPVRPVRIVVPFAAGGGVDLTEERDPTLGEVVKDSGVKPQ